VAWRKTRVRTLKGVRGLQQLAHGPGYGTDGFAFPLGQRRWRWRRDGRRARRWRGRYAVGGDLSGEVGFAGCDCGDRIHQVAIRFGIIRRKDGPPGPQRRDESPGIDIDKDVAPCGVPSQTRDRPRGPKGYF
jgi:hypothetical protein